MDTITKILTKVCACGLLPLFNFFRSTVEINHRLGGGGGDIQLREEQHVGQCK
jgi:hypothetical protein